MEATVEKLFLSEIINVYIRVMHKMDVKSQEIKLFAGASWITWRNIKFLNILLEREAWLWVMIIVSGSHIDIFVSKTWKVSISLLSIFVPTLFYLLL